MAKLSLWLITLAKGRPFSFLDHALRAGDSLLGISDVEQLMNWSLRKGDEAKPVQIPLIRHQVEEALEVALRERRKIAGTLVREARDADLKAGWLSTAESALALVRLGADLLVAAELVPDKSVRETLRKDWLARYSLLLSAAEDTRAGKFTIGGQTDAANRGAFAQLRAEAERYLQGRRPFHWPVEFPEVFDLILEERSIEQTLDEAKAGKLSVESPSPGFSAVVGNPPFMGGSKITGALGENYRELIVRELAGGAKGKADLCAYFMLRAKNLLSPWGGFGLIMTNSISQGDNRLVSIDYITKNKGKIIRAWSNWTWPGPAGVTVALVWVSLAQWSGTFVLDGSHVAGITPFLTIANDIGFQKTPQYLKQNELLSFRGTEIKGLGFVLDPLEAHAILEQEPSSKDVIFPYLTGEDLNSRPDQSASRMVINFHNWDFERANQYQRCMQIVTEKVKPYRETITKQIHESDYWKFWDKRLDCYARIAGMRRVLVRSQVGNRHSMTFQPTNIVFSHKVLVFIRDAYSDFSVLQSSLHEEWARHYSGASLRTDMCYSTKQCLETFAFPEFQDDSGQKITNLSSSSRNYLESIGEKYYEYRYSVALERNEGLTKTYNRFHNPQEASEDIAELRRLHVEMDNAVAAAYGWSDLELDHGFHETKQGLRYTISEAARRAVLDRLLALNHARYAEEVAAGLHEKKKGSGAGDRGSGKRKRADGAMANSAGSEMHVGPRSLAPDPQLTLDFFGAPEGEQSVLQANRDEGQPPDPQSLIPEPYVRLKAILSQRGSLANGDVQAALGVDGETARALLQRLVDEGLATVEGQRRGTRYVRRG
ncbi:Eco57I restriction-modification methylase domain-containing protein [Candidatus Chloroploca mongolica]|uniref:Eco57I restriction-modification methylase domain-containing protein n=1 Tax=Candidatus Chloroploca mongolica TaxID=2528176 RepID=UPI003FCC689B